MTIKASGRSALILATGLWVCFAGPSQAAADSDATRHASSNSAGAPCTEQYTKHASHHWKKYAHHKSSKVAQKSAPDKKAAEAAGRRCRQFADGPIIRDPGLGRQRQCATGRRRHAGRQRQGDVGAGQQHRAGTPDDPADASRPPTPRSSPPISSTMSIARCSDSTPPAAPLAAGLGRRRRPRAAAPRPPAAAKLHLGPDLADRKDLHRLRRAADDGLRRAHVHGVSDFEPGRGASRPRPRTGRWNRPT